MTAPQPAPFGSWKSPITPDLIASGTITLGQIAFDGADVYWVETRPGEGGRNVIVRWRPESGAGDVTPTPFSVRTRVHEYGGGSFLVSRGAVYFVNFADQRIYRRQGEEAPQAVTIGETRRYADAIHDVRRNRVKPAAALLVALAMLGGRAGAREGSTSLEPLLKASDFEAIGVKGVVLAARHAYDRVEQLGFERASDSSMVAVLARLEPTQPGQTLGSLVKTIASDAAPVSGVGDEAYSYLAGVAFGFRKGKATFQLMSGFDGLNPSLSREQLAALAKKICGKMSASHQLILPSPSLNL